MKTKYLIAVVLMALGFSSCEDALKENSYGQPTTDELLKNPENAALLVGQVYADLKWLHDHWGYWGILTGSSDECAIPVRMPDAHWSDNVFWMNINTMDWKASDDAFSGVWDFSLRGATLCNIIIQQLTEVREEIGDEIYNQYVAELVVVRSYYYYTLFDAFGRIPYTKSATDDASKRELMDAKDVWANLVEDLRTNAYHLPLANDPSKAQNYGRVTQGFAHALLARLFLNAPSYGVEANNSHYDNCILYCDSIINSGVYTTSGSFFDNFAINNENSDENIFVIVENGDDKVDNPSGGMLMAKLRLVYLTMHYQHQQAWNLVDLPWNGFCAPSEFINKHYDNPNDLRGLCDSTRGTRIDFSDPSEKRGWFVGPVVDPVADTTLCDEKGTKVKIVNNLTSIDSASWNDGARLMKYEIQIDTQTAGHKYMDNDFVLMRYADVLYMKLEALARGGAGDVGSEKSDLDRIRTRVNLTAFASVPSVDEILLERGREFAWELSRRRDLIRFGQYASGEWVGKTSKPEDYNWFPIPQKVLDVNAGIWSQNNGY